MPKFRCRSCGQKVFCPDEAVGKRFRCPRCGTSLLVPPLHDPSVISPSATAPVPAVTDKSAVDDSDPTPLLDVAPVQIRPGELSAPMPVPPTRPVAVSSVLPETTKMPAIESPVLPPTQQPHMSVPQTAIPTSRELETPVSVPVGVEVQRAPSVAVAMEPSSPRPDEKSGLAVAVPVAGAADTVSAAAMGVQRRRRQRAFLTAAGGLLVGAAAGAGLTLHFQSSLLKEAPGIAKKLAELRNDAQKLEVEGQKEAAVWRYEEMIRLAAGHKQVALATRDLVNEAEKKKEQLQAEVMTAKGFVLLGGEWVPKERGELEQVKTERDTLKAERDALKTQRDALKAQLETMQVSSGRVRISVSVRAGRFGMPWPDAGALAILIPKDAPGKLPALATLRDRNKLRENQQAASEKGAYVDFTGRDGQLAFEGVKSGGYILIIVSANVLADPTSARTNRERLSRFFDAVDLANQVHTAEVNIAPGEQKNISHQFGVLRRQ